VTPGAVGRTATTRSFAPLLLLALSGPGLAQEVAWRRDYGAALKEAAAKGAPLFVNVGTADCFWCKKLDAGPFADAEVVKLLNDRCVPLKLDANAPANAYLVQALKVQSYPTLIFAGFDGNILGYQEGFLDSAALKERVTKVLAAVATPDWMQRDYDIAAKAISDGDVARAVSLLRNVVEDGKSRPVQAKARMWLAEVEAKASEHAAKARELADKGKTGEAIEALTQLDKTYPGTLAARRGTQLRAELVSRSADERKRQAGELLRLARDDHKGQQYLCALDRCEEIASRFADLAEAADAEKLAAEIKDNPEWTRKAADQLGDRLCVMYLSLADACLKKGQPQQATFYLERVEKMFPGTRHAEMAQTRLSRLRGAPAVTDRK
jgi:TolA-binding protein